MPNRVGDLVIAYCTSFKALSDTDHELVLAEYPQTSVDNAMEHVTGTFPGPVLLDFFDSHFLSL